ncbi:hypothetical protein HAX54_033375, partial [Datura stramonium]|nr:hypothetical protein [Datura stramonium]
LHQHDILDFKVSLPPSNVSRSRRPPPVTRSHPCELTGDGRFLTASPPSSNLPLSEALPFVLVVQCIEQHSVAQA